MLGFLSEIFSNQGFMPHIHCYLGKPSLVWTMVITDTLIGLAYVSISITLWILVRKIQIPFSAVALCFGIFIGACGATHFMEVYNLWTPDYWLAAFVKVITAIASVGTGIYLIRLRHPILTVAEAAKLSEQRRLDLEVLTKSLEQRVEERTQTLERALRVRDEFFSVASHELRTPLTSLKMKTQMAIRGIGVTAENSDSRRFMGEVNEQVERLSRLVEDMLDISRYRAGVLKMSFAKHDLTEVLHSSLNRLKPQAEVRGVPLMLTVLEPVSGNFDRTRIEQVIANLVVNALKYASGSPVKLTLGREADRAILSVKDQGPGIAPEDQERIFHRFEQLSREDHQGGMGVGLYLSRAIVEAHGGILRVESEPGKGANFIIELPLEPLRSNDDLKL